MFVHTLLPKLQAKNDNRFEYAFPEYVKNIILIERRGTVFHTNT